MKNRFAFPTLFALLFIFLSPYADAAQIKLAWDPPTKNADGTPLTDLSGYKIYWGTSSGTYENSADVGNVTICVLSDLIEGQTYFIAVIAYDNFVPPDESDYSNEVTGVAINPVLFDCSSLGFTPQNTSFPFSGGAHRVVAAGKRRVRHEPTRATCRARTLLLRRVGSRVCPAGPAHGTECP